MKKIALIYMVLLNVNICICQEDNSISRYKVDSSTIKRGYYIDPIYPQPFGDISNFKFGIPDSSIVNIIVTNEKADTIKILCDSILINGDYLIKWDEKDRNNQKVKSGLYFILIEARSKKKNAGLINMYFKGYVGIIVIQSE
jgi:hypothetical protein